MNPASIPSHHGEPADPTLLGWITDKLHELISLGPLPVVLVLGALILVVPLAVAALALRQRKRPVR